MDTHHPTIAAVLRANASVGETDKLAAVRRELESEAKGLLMAARMHGFSISVMDGTAVVTDLRTGK